MGHEPFTMNENAVIRMGGGMTPKEVVKFARDHGARMVDLKFMDFPGMWQHFTIPMSSLDDDTFEEGVGFDGSSIRGWQAIHASDMVVLPDPETAVMDPFTQVPTLSLICNILDPITREQYTRDPRSVAEKGEAYLRATGIADTAYFGPEPEFFIFDDVRFDFQTQCGYFFVDSIEGQWNMGRAENPNLGYKSRYKEGYFPVPPTDHFMDIRTEMALILEEPGTAGTSASSSGGNS